VLIVDDEPLVRDLLTRWLGVAGYACAAVDCAAAAWAYVQEQPVDLVTLDITMPGGSGLDLLDQIKRTQPDVAALMLTAESDTAQAIRALTAGAYGYLIKPIDRQELLAQVTNAIERQRLVIENRAYLLGLETKVREQTQTIRMAHEETIHRLLAATMCRDEETGAHVRRVGLFSEVLALAAGWSPSEAEQLRFAAPMHDVGKIGIPDAILRKQGPLNSEEYAMMKCHTTIGARMLGGSSWPLLQMACAIAQYHHERWDGKGYLQGLRGDAIPEAARIVAIVDVYDALSHDRIYRPALPEENVLEILRQGAGSQFDPALLAHFFLVLDEIREIALQHPDQPEEANPNDLVIPRDEAGEVIRGVLESEYA
jgi:putative two-component system response regulator